jgi:hypothetical protein
LLLLIDIAVRDIPASHLIGAAQSRSSKGPIILLEGEISDPLLPHLIDVMKLPIITKPFTGSYIAWQVHRSLRAIREN